MTLAGGGGVDFLQPLDIGSGATPVSDRAGSYPEVSAEAEFLEAGTEYELEVLALEISGNQTITVGFFETE